MRFAFSLATSGSASRCANTVRRPDSGELLGDSGAASQVPSPPRASLWLLACALALYYVPLHAQRPLSFLLLLAALFLGQEGLGLLPPTPGLGWLRVVLPVKYILSHPVRFEPYRD